jgi:hypothetical protein
MTPTKLITDTTEIIHITTTDTTKQRNPSLAKDVYEADEHETDLNEERKIADDTVRIEPRIDQSPVTEMHVAQIFESDQQNDNNLIPPVPSHPTIQNAVPHEIILEAATDSVVDESKTDPPPVRLVEEVREVPVS